MKDSKHEECTFCLSSNYHFVDEHSICERIHNEVRQPLEELPASTAHSNNGLISVKV